MNLINERGSTLKVQCPQARTMQLSNAGHCLQVGLPRAARIQVMGSGNVSILLGPMTLSTTIDVSGMKAGSVYVRLSQLQGDGEMMRGLLIKGRLPFVGTAAVIVEGCGMAKVACAARDQNKQRACRLINKCTSDTLVAKQSMLALLITSPVCSMP